MNVAFSVAEQKQIVYTMVQNPDNAVYNTKGGNPTADKVFLLSIDEANKYFLSNSARVCAGTAYAYANDVYYVDNGSCWWWLRSLGSVQNCAAIVGPYGGVDETGIPAGIDFCAIRPVLWIELVS